MTKKWLILLLVWQITGATVYGQDVVKLPAPKIRGQVMKALKNRTSIKGFKQKELPDNCLLYTSPSPRDATLSRMPSSA